METDDTRQIGLDLPVAGFSRITHNAPPPAYGAANLRQYILHN
jgi:hypothetical protein